LIKGRSLRGTCLDGTRLASLLQRPDCAQSRFSPLPVADIGREAVTGSFSTGAAERARPSRMKVSNPQPRE